MQYENYKIADFLTDEYFVRYICDPDEETRLFWKEWLTAHPEKKNEVEEATELLLFLKQIKPSPSTSLKEKIWLQIEQRLSGRNTGDLSIPDAAPSVKFSLLKAVNGRFARFAAIFIGLIMAGAILYFNYSNEKSIRFHTRYGQIRTVELPDGSLVDLNANSTLSYGSDWGNNHEREVWLTGEAFFKVAKRLSGKNALFIVHAGNLDIQVLGTHFNVNNRRNKTEVVLSSGRVKVFNTDTSRPGVLYMDPGEMVSYESRNHRFGKKEVDTTLYTSWTEHLFVFKNTPIKAIAQRLKDTYGYDVTIANDSLANLTFTADIKISNEDDVQLLLNLLAESFHCSIEKRGRRIIIRNSS